MRRQKRLVTWRDLEWRLMNGEGTAIEEVGLKGAERVWWTPDDNASLGRLPSSYREVSDVLDGAPHAFNDWCLSEYLDPERGRAMTPRFLSAPCGAASWQGVSPGLDG
jgi:hypothetical protein